MYTLKFQIITYLVVPRFSRSCDSHFDLAIVHLIEIFHIGDRIHLEISMRNTGFKLKDKMSRLQVKFVICVNSQETLIKCKQNCILGKTESAFTIHATFETFSENLIFKLQL